MLHKFHIYSSDFFPCSAAAFAVEGQVKEKSRWFSELGDLMKKVKVLIDAY